MIRDPTPPEGNPSPRAATQPFDDAPFLRGAGLLYVVTAIATVLVLDRAWSANVDAVTFLEAARSFWDGGSVFDLYAGSRETRTWPYAYPPLHALLLAPFVWLADLITGGASVSWPQLIAVRVPILLADLGIGLTLYRILRRSTGERRLARAGVALWLFNPILFYHSTVQAHLETLWLWPVLAAYDLLQRRGAQGLGRPLGLLVLAMAVKQTALLFAVPVGLFLLMRRRWRAIAGWAAGFALIWGGMALPFWLHSDDFAFMVFEYVGRMPVQIQSWQVWALAFEGWRLEGTRTLFPTVQYAIWLTLALNGAIAVGALRRGRSWSAMGILVTTSFLLTAHKAMAYHYVILLPFLIAWGVRARAFRVLAWTLVWTTWVVVSPYFAPWASFGRLPAYALLGTLNSVFYAWLLGRVLTGHAGQGDSVAHVRDSAALLITAFGLAVVAHPLSRGILAVLAGVSEATRLGALAGLMGTLFVATLLLTPRVSRLADRVLGQPAVSTEPTQVRAPVALALAVLFVPLFFTWFTMNAEITAVLERGLAQSWLR